MCSVRCFNPTLVRLRPFHWLGKLTFRSLFQSHAGSIEADILRSRTDSVWICFNPTLVRLRPLAMDRGWKVLRSRFNPTLVRLRPFPVCGFLLQSTCQFQSHAGSIEAHHTDRAAEEWRYSFNPTLVRLRPLPQWTTTASGSSGFNPTLVRLRPPPKASHKNPGGSDFNPTLVRLRPGVQEVPRPGLGRISIPRWFD